MFILKEPYVSKYLLETLEKNQYPVFENQFVKKLKKNFNLNLVDEKNIKTSNFNGTIFLNSENAIEDVLNKFTFKKLSKTIRICKDKNKFRKALSSLYPNFYFKKINISKLKNIDAKKIKFPIVLKPTVGFLSIGVYKIHNKKEWENTIFKIQNEISKINDIFPESVLKSSSFILEELIEGTEYAVDAYFDKQGKPVILDIFEHPFLNKSDVKDRIYITSKNIILDKLNQFTKLLSKIGSKIKFSNFPIHIELIENNKNEIIPVEINPMRFAGWCTTDIAFYAYGINIYEYFVEGKKPNWNKILNKKKNETYYFAIMEIPSEIQKRKIQFVDYEKLESNFENILDLRKIDYKKNPLLEIIFGKTNKKKDISKILKLNSKDFIK